MTAHIKVRDVSVDYQNNGYPFRVLYSLELDVPETQFLSIVGPSGCGKTTLLRLVAGLVSPTSGEVTVAGMPAEEARALRATSFVFQSPVLFPWRTVLDNVLLPMQIIHNRRANGVTRAQEMIGLVGLKGFENAYPHQLSGGMQKRVAIARALTYDPKILLMDEPFGDLDELTRARLNMELLGLWVERNSTILFVTHSVSEAIFLADRVVAMGPCPSSIVEDVSVSIPRPRSLDVQETADFGAYARVLRRAIGMK